MNIVTLFIASCNSSTEVDIIKESSLAEVIVDDLIENNTVTTDNANANDTVTGSSGNDILDGGDGIDSISYANALSGVTVNLNVSEPQNTFGAGIDQIINFENLIGSNFNDNLTDGIGDNTLTGSDGSDTFNITSGINVITDLTTGDILVVFPGATANASNISSFIATAMTKNEGTVILTATSTSLNDILPSFLQLYLSIISLLS